MSRKPYLVLKFVINLNVEQDMGFAEEFKARIFETNADNFKSRALQLFKFQARKNLVYNEYLSNLNINIEEVNDIDKIPYLPIQFFKHHRVSSSEKDLEYVFTSSGTTGSNTSRHEVVDLQFYLKNTERIFELFYGPISKYTFLALLPSYLERKNSSLISMMDFFINQSQTLDSGYFLYNHDELFERLQKLKHLKNPTVLFGVTFALLDFIEKHQLNFPELIVFETGGMKGRRKEMLREELHPLLQNAFGINAIHSEYGMTELYSQAYSLGHGKFQTPPWMKVTLRDISDPLSPSSKTTGAINVIDFANIESCSFIATDDIGRMDKNEMFEILGRLDNSDIRGCNLMIES